MSDDYTKCIYCNTLHFKDQACKQFVREMLKECVKREELNRFAIAHQQIAAHDAQLSSSREAHNDLYNDLNHLKRKVEQVDYEIAKLNGRETEPACNCECCENDCGCAVEVSSRFTGVMSFKNEMAFMASFDNPEDAKRVMDLIKSVVDDANETKRKLDWLTRQSPRNQRLMKHYETTHSVREKRDN